MSTWQVIEAPAPAALADLPDGHFHAIVTSPPYWRLRDYETGGVDWPVIRYKPMPCIPCEVEVPAWRGELGHEDSPVDYVGHVVHALREGRRVLRSDGTLWLNLGDSWCGGGPGGGGDPMRRHASYRRDRRPTAVAPHKGAPGLKPKDVAGIPWRVALALQADGWWLRTPVTWYKPNATPSSVRDRPTTAHEDLFLLSPSRRYFYDQVAEIEIDRSARASGNGFGKPKGDPTTSPDRTPWEPGSGRVLRSVWEIRTEPSGVPHYATFPLELPRRCISLSTSARGCCSACGAPWCRIVKRHRTLDGQPIGGSYGDRGRHRKPAGVGNWRFATEIRTAGWRPGCDCDAEVEPCRVLDLFSGVGTTGRAALLLGRSYVGIEPGHQHADHQRNRLRRASLCAAELGDRPEPPPVTGGLFAGGI